MSVEQRYAAWVHAESSRIDTSLVLQMQRMVVLTLGDVFIDLTLRTAESQRDRLNPFERMNEPQLDEVLWGTPGVDSETLNGWSKTRVHPSQTVQSGVLIDDVLRDCNFNVILGDPGSGKTTLLRSLAQRWVSSSSSACGPHQHKQSTADNWVPVPITLRYFAQDVTGNESLSLKDFLEGENWRYSKNASDDDYLDFGRFVLNQAAAGNCLFLLDGLDEAISSPLRGRVVDAIDRLTRDFPRCRFVVSSRIVGYELAELPSTFQTWVLEPFSRRQTHDFFQKWSRAVEAKQNPDGILDEFARRRAEALAEGILTGLGIDPEKLDENNKPAPGKERLQELARNPMLSTLIGLVYYNGQQMPDARAELYRLCIEAFVFDWEIRKRTLDIERQSLNKFETLDVLEELAFQLHKGGVSRSGSSNRLSKSDIELLTERFLVDEKGYSESMACERTKHLIQLIHERTGLLIERGHDEFGFAHLQFQEYLAGRALVRRSREIRPLLDLYLWVGRWQEPIILAAAHRASHSEEAASEFIEAILDTTPLYNDAQAGPFEPPVPNLEEVLHHALFMAARSWNDAQRVHYRTRKRISDAVGVLFADTSRVYLWYLAIQHLNRIASQVDPAPLLGLLRENANARIRINSAFALGLLRSESAVSALLVAFREDPSSSVRIRSAFALGLLRSESAVSALLESLREDPNEHIRRRTANALGSIRSESAVPALLASLREDASAK